MIYFLETEAEKISYETELDHSEHVVDLEEDQMDPWIYIELGWAHLLIFKAKFISPENRNLTRFRHLSHVGFKHALTKSKPLDTPKNWKSPKYEKKKNKLIQLLFWMQIQLNT